MRIVVSRQIDDLNKIEWLYWLKETELHLDVMYVYQRDTKRHKFRTDLDKSYHRIHQREFGIKEEPDVDIDIQMEALEKARNAITIQKWRRK